MGDPWFPFFPGDWRSDEGLRLCSLAARGLWVDMLCVMHAATPRGHLKVNGRIPSTEELAGMLGRPAEEVEFALLELDRWGVYSRGSDGEVTSRRMVRDTKLSTARAKAGRKGGKKSRGVAGEARGEANPKAKGKANPKAKVYGSGSSSNKGERGLGEGGAGDLFGPSQPLVEALARYWMGTRTAYQDSPQLVEQHLQAWCDALEKLVRLDGHSWELVEKVVRWTAEDKVPHRKRGSSWTGWADAVASAPKLRQRQKSTGLKFFDVLRERMAAQQQSQGLGPTTDPESFEGSTGIPVDGGEEGEGE
jgi:hypothetical protein